MEISQKQAIIFYAHVPEYFSNTIENKVIEP